MDGFEVIVKAGEEITANSVDLRGMDADEIDRVITSMGAAVMRTIREVLKKQKRRQTCPRCGHDWVWGVITAPSVWAIVNTDGSFVEDDFSPCARRAIGKRRCCQKCAWEWEVNDDEASN